jgi:hypothetical protein
MKRHLHGAVPFGLISVAMPLHAGKGGTDRKTVGQIHEEMPKSASLPQPYMIP